MQPSERSDSLALTAECLQSRAEQDGTAITAAASRFSQTLTPRSSEMEVRWLLLCGRGHNERAISLRWLFAPLIRCGNFVPFGLRAGGLRGTGGAGGAVCYSHPGK